MEVSTASVLPIHNHKRYLEVCCDLLNDEWPRSHTARMHSLESSCDNLPTSLILVLNEIDTKDELVIGHSKISSLHKMPNGCFVESVVISKKFRGQGWGRYIMLETEKYAKLKGKSVLYLSTSDQKDFYEKLGYTICEPVSIYGGKYLTLNNNFVSSLLPYNVFKSLNLTSSFAPTPPPPPPKSKFFEPNKKVYMRKLL